ncbi:lyase family protein [Stappia sp. ES.058]|uniref:lyase family protein n=1 Tax=Stappia sp. ES.058 TaxID=1881061 RepID=UPI00087B01AD|nr:lyase family protein [Stappia sp. ES.058]SDU43684.1 3-carboxy-cis,cis-muconate cycloisomerase [Stappia sp. ES.058]
MAISPLDSPLYVDLFGDPDTARHFEASAEIAAMVEVEIALARVQARASVIPDAAAQAIAAGLSDSAPAPEDICAGTAAAGVPVPALVAHLRKQLSKAGADHLHFGATSQDIVDTGLMLRLQRVLELFDRRLAALVDTLVALAVEHRATPMAGRTRGQVATPVTFGLRVANWALPVARAHRDLRFLRRAGLPVQLGGASGDLSAMGPDGSAVTTELAEELGLASSSPWMADRWPLVRVAGTLASLLGGLEKIGADVMLSTRSEIGELRLAASGGSSTMPQKQNPVAAETLIALTRHAAALSAQITTAPAHAEERDGAAWMGEWLVLPQLVIASGAALLRAQWLADALEPQRARMAEIAFGDGGLALAERFSFALIPHVGRAQAQDLVKQAAMETRASGRPLIDALRAISDAPLDWEALADPNSVCKPAAAMTDAILAEIRRPRSP